MAKSLLERIPSVHELLENPTLRSMVDRVNHHVVVNEVRTFLDQLRQEIRTRAGDFQLPTATELADRIADWIQKREQSCMRPVINATGVVLHTGLGRAPLAPAVADALNAVVGQYTSLELDLESGDRGDRLQFVEARLKEMTHGEAAVVVNNCAAATVLVLATLATGREVVVSRGELIEIGGSYRLPDVMSASGAILREVGTTNRTGLGDYERVISDRTGALLKAHTSNYRVVGFTESVSLRDLVQLGKNRHLPVVHDLGSGALVDLKPYGIPDEPLVRDSIAAGADLVLFSGDKLLGGPQCGIVVGRQDWIDSLRRHPLMRAFRVGKLTLAALEATLGLYRRPSTAEQEIPLLSIMSTSTANLQHRAERLAPQLAACAAVQSAEARAGESELGGGSTPERPLPTWCVVVNPAGRSVDQLARQLRLGHPAIVARIQRDQLWLDLRTVFPRQDSQIVDAFQQLSTEPTPDAPAVDHPPSERDADTAPPVAGPSPDLTSPTG